MRLAKYNIYSALHC